MKESKRRSFAKVLSWRTTATLTTVIISFIITGSTDFAVKIGVIEVIAKILLHYLHERIWNRMTFGTNDKNMDYQI